jgi:hypothetical protein
VADGEDSHNSLVLIDDVHDAEAPHAILPRAGELSYERFTQDGITANSLKGTCDGAPEIRRQMANDLGNMGRNVDRVSGH